MLEFLKKALGLGNDALLKPLFKIADQIDALEPQMEKLTDEIKENFYQSLEKEKSEEITDRMVREISSQIEDCLTKMAKIVEIPLG